MHFSAPILVAILSVCPSIAAQYMYGSEDVSLDFLEARDEYLIARDNFLQARGIYGISNEGKLLIRDFDDDDAVLVRRVDCSVCGARTSHNSDGGVCLSCRRKENQRRQKEAEEEKKRQEAAEALLLLSKGGDQGAKSGGQGTNSAPPRGGKSATAGGAAGRSGGARTAKTGARRSR